LKIPLPKKKRQTLNKKTVFFTVKVNSKI
jgi:hypothetical protein